MDFHGMKRKKMQDLCKKHGIPANLKNCEMANRLALIFKEKEESTLEEQSSSGNSVKANNVQENIVESRKKKVKFSPESEIFEFTRSVKKSLRRSGRIKGEGPSEDFHDSGNLVGRPKRNSAKEMSQDVPNGLNESDSDTGKKPGVIGKRQPNVSNGDVLEERKVLRRSKRIACNDEAMIERPPGKFSEKCLEEGKILMPSKQFAGKDTTKGLPLRTKVNEPEMEDITQDNTTLAKVSRRSKRIAANVEEPRVEAPAIVIEPRTYPQNSQVGKARRSKRLAAGDEAEGESVKNNADEPKMGYNAQMDAQDVVEVEKVQRRSRRNANSVNVHNAVTEINANKLHLVDENLETVVNDDSQGGALKFSFREFKIRGDIQETEKQPRNCQNDFQDINLLQRSVKKSLRRSGRIKGEGPSEDFPDSGNLVGRPKRNSAKEMSQYVPNGLNESDSDTGKKPGVIGKRQPNVSNGDVLEERKVLRRSKRIACNDEAMIERPPGKFSEKCLEEGKILMPSQQFAGQDTTKGLPLRTKVNEPEMEDITQDNTTLAKVSRRSKRIAANVEEPRVEAPAVVIEPRTYPQNSQVGKARRSKRLAAGDEAEGESVKNNADEPKMGYNAQMAEKLLGRDAQDVVEVEKVQRRSRRNANSVNVHNAVTEINANKLHLVDENLETVVNDDSKGGALKFSFREFKIRGDIQETEKQPWNCQNDFQDIKLLQRSKHPGVDDHAQGGAPVSNMDDRHAKGWNQVTEEQCKRPNDDGLELGKAMRRSKRLAANGEEQVGDLGIREKPNVKLKTQAAKQRTRKSAQVGLEAGNNFRRSKRFATNDNKQAGAFGDNAKKPHTEDEEEVPLRYTRNASRHNSRKAPEVLNENPLVRETNEACRPLVKAPLEDAWKMKRDISEMPGITTEVILIENSNSSALEEIVTECAQLEPEAAGIKNDTEFNRIELITRSSEKKKMAEQKCMKEKPQSKIDNSPSLSEVEAVKPVMSIETVLDSPSEKPAEASEGTDSQKLVSALAAKEHEEERDIQAETDEILSLSPSPNEGISAGAKSNDSGGLSEMRTRVASSSSDSYLSEEATIHKASVQLAESKVESEIDVLRLNVLSKDITPVFTLEEDTENKKETKASILKSDASEHIHIDEATAQGILEKCPSVVIKSSPGCGKEICSSHDHGKAHMEKEVQVACLSGNLCNYNAGNGTAEEQTEVNLICDTNCGKNPVKAMTVLSNTTLEGRTTSKQEEAVGIISCEKYIDGADIDSEGMTKSSFVKQINMLVTDRGSESAQKAYSTECVNHFEMVQTAEGHDQVSQTMLVGEETENSEERMTETMIEHHNCTETGIQEIEETDVQAKGTASLTCEERNPAVTCDNLKLNEIVANEAVVVKTSINREDKEAPGNKEDTEIGNIADHEFVSEDKGVKAISGKVTSTHCEKLKTPESVRYDSVKKFEDKFSDGGDKREVLNLSICPPTEFASLTSDELYTLKVFDEENMDTCFQGMSGSVNCSVINEEVVSVKDNKWVDNSDVLENYDVAVDDACVVPEKAKMGFGIVSTNSEKVASMSSFASSFGDKSRLSYTGISSPREDTEWTACKEKGIKAETFCDESLIFTTPERYLMLEEQLDETGKASASESLTHDNNEGEESHDRPVIFTSPEQHLLLGDSGLDDSGKKGEKSAIEFHDEPVVFTSPERYMLLGDSRLSEDGKEVENTAAEFCCVSVIPAGSERRPSLGNSGIDETGKNEENKAVEFHGESCIFPGEERHVASEDNEPDEAENKGVNAPSESRDKTAVFTGPEGDPFLEGSEIDESGKNDENKALEFHVESRLFTSPERDVLLGGSVTDEGGSSGENAAAEFQDKSATSPGWERQLLAENSELEGARKNAESEAAELQSESGVVTSPERHLLLRDSELDGTGVKTENRSAEFHDKTAVFASPERYQLLRNSELDEAGKSDENKAVEFHVESCLLTSLKRHLFSDDTEVDEAGNTEETKTMEFNNQSSLFTTSERHLIWGESGLDGSGRKGENKEVEFHDDATILHSTERHLMLGDSELDKDGLKGGLSGADEWTEFNASGATIGALEHATQVLKGEEGQHDMPSGVNREHADGDSDNFDLSQSQSHSSSAPEVIWAENTEAIPSYDALDTKESISVDSNGSSTPEVKQMDAQMEDGEETSNEGLGNLSQVDSVNLGDPDNQSSETMVEVESTLPHSQVLALTRDGNSYEGSEGMDLSAGGHPEAGRTSSVMNPSSSPFDSEASKAYIRSQDQINNPEEKQMLPGDIDESTPAINAISSVELPLQDNNKDEQDGEIISSPPETLQGPPSTISERDPSLIHRTQVKPLKHDMKENPVNSKIEQTLNETAPRTSKRRPLQDLMNN